MAAHGMIEEEMQYVRTHMRRILQQMFLDRPINSPSEFFSIWQEIRKVLEEELESLVNENLREQLNKIKQD